ncbi:MAG: tRNA (guanosine(37)-N1)-methyltransferase TrmD, partial [Eubacteriales bacterium]
QMVLAGLNTSILARAMGANHIQINAIDIRDYTKNKHKKVDDYPYGGGAGMLMQAQPVYDAYLHVRDSIQSHKSDQECGNQTRVVYVTPQGSIFDQKKAQELAQEEDLILLCGHYEGIDERVLEEIVTDFISIGDYVLTGGELPAMVMVDAIARLVPGVLNNKTSCITESHTQYLLEHPQYSRPEEWNGKVVPPVLLSGHHSKIDQWKVEESICRTKERRPDLYEKYCEQIKSVQNNKKCSEQ